MCLRPKLKKSYIKNQKLGVSISVSVHINTKWLSPATSHVQYRNSYIKNVKVCSNDLCPFLAQNKLLLPDADAFVEIFSDYETYLKKLGSELTKMVLPLCF